MSQWSDTNACAMSPAVIKHMVSYVERAFHGLPQAVGQRLCHRPRLMSICTSIQVQIAVSYSPDSDYIRYVHAEKACLCGLISFSAVC